MTRFDGASGVEVRRRFDIVGYVGPNGSGKSLLAVADSLASLDAGRPVLSTVRLLDWRNPRPCEDPECSFDGHPDHGAAHPLWLPFQQWADLLDARECDVLMDEVAGVASSRQSMGLPAPVEVQLQQLRKRDVRLRWTAPAWARADRIIRECTQAVVMCKGLIRRQVDGSEWLRSTWVKGRLLDAREVDDLTDGVVRRAHSLHVSWAKVAAMEARNAYESGGSVMALPVAEGGRCVVCGGRRHVPSCRCESSA